MKIPKIIHQTWKDAEIPSRWKNYQRAVKTFHPDWEYRLWTDADNDAFVKENFPDFYPVYAGFSNNIMRADVIRYLIMYRMGGLYLDLDYEFLKPFDFKEAEVVLPANRSAHFGDEYDGIGNCVFASVPGHPFWNDVIEDLKRHPPAIKNYDEIIGATGPLLLTRIYNSNKYEDILVPERLAFHPPVPKSKKEYAALKTNGITYGIHHGWGSWKERFTFFHLKRKFAQWAR